MGYLFIEIKIVVRLKKKKIINENNIANKRKIKLNGSHCSMYNTVYDLIIRTHVELLLTCV